MRFLTAGLCTFVACLTACSDDDPMGEELELVRLLPITGPLGQQATSIEAGQNLALQEINQGGGVLGAQLAFRTLDTEASAQRTVELVDELLEDEQTIFLGPISSSAAGAALEKSVPAGALLMSPAAGATFLSDGDNQGLFYRTAPTNESLAIALSDALRAEGAVHVGILESSNFYTSSLSGTFRQLFEAMDCGDVDCTTTVASYSEDEDFSSFDFGASIDSLLAEQPDAIFFSSYPTDGLEALTIAIERNYDGTPYVSAPMINGEISQFVSDEVTASLRWPAPVEDEGEGQALFRALYKAAFEKEDDSRLTWQAYDATILLALAAAHAGEFTGEDVASSLREVANAPGEIVHPGEYEKALQLIADGEDIDYEGASGSIEFDEKGDVQKEAAIYRFNESGEQTRVD